MASPAAPITAGDSETVINSTASESAVITRPSNVVDGDLMVMILERADVTAAITGPSGWTKEEDTPHDGGDTTVWYLVAGASEPADYTWSWTGSTRNCGAIQRVTGADTTTPIADSPAPATGVSALPDPPDSSGLSSDDYLAVSLVGMEGKVRTFTVSTSPGTYTENVDGIGTSGSGSHAAHASGYIQSRQFTGTGEATGVVTAIASDGWAANTLIIAPSAVPPADVYPPYPRTRNRRVRM